MVRSLPVRLDARVLDALERAVKSHGITKRRFLEEAIRRSAAQPDATNDGDVWSSTLGAWQRPESPATARGHAAGRRSLVIRPAGDSWPAGISRER